MQRWGNGRLSAAVWLAVLMLASWDTAAAQDFAGREKLRAHGEQEFRKDIVTVADGVYVAVGYSMANVTLIVGDGGTIIVDTTSKVDDAQAGRARFDRAIPGASGPWMSQRGGAGRSRQRATDRRGEPLRGPQPESHRSPRR